MNIQHHPFSRAAGLFYTALLWVVWGIRSDGATPDAALAAWQTSVQTETECITGLPVRAGAPFEQALQVVESVLLKNEFRSLELSAKKSIGSNARTVLSTWGGKTITAPWKEYWLFFADDAPLANWAHPCRYIFVAPDLSAIAVQHALTPLEVRAAGRNSTSGEERLDVVIPFARPVRSRSAETATTPLKTAHPRADSQNSNRYAVIISGGYNNGNNHIRYWGDAAYMYSTLILKYAFLKTNVYALISDGLNPAADRSDDTNSPFDLDGDGEPDTCGPATATVISNVLIHLQSILTTNDQLFIFTTDHGGPTSGGGDWDTELNLWNLEVLTDYDLAALTTNIPCPILFAMEQCYSGGFLDNLAQSNRVIATAAQYNESSYAGDTYPDYDQWCYHWTAAMSGHYPTTAAQTPWVDGESCNADTNGDGRVSFREAYDYAYAHKYANDHPMFQSVPADLCDRLFLGDVNVMAGYTVSPVTSPQTTNLPFSVRINARNPFGVPLTNAPDQAYLEGIADPIDNGWYVGERKDTWDYPLQAYYEDARTQVIYPANLLNGPCTLTNLALNLTQLPGGPLSNWTIRLRHTELDAYPAENPVWETSDWVVVYQTLATNAATGWVDFPFTTPFEYNGTNHLMIDFSFNNDEYSTSGYCAIDTSSVSRCVVCRTDSEYGDPLEWGGTNPPPEISFNFPCLRFGPPPIPVSVAIEPTNITGFTDGVWTGDVRVLEPSTNMWIHVVGTNAAWTGDSNPFAVLDYHFALTNVQAAADSDAVILQWQSGSNQTYTLRTSTNLAAGFTVLVTHIPATPPMNQYCITNDPGHHTFYSIEQE